MNIECVMSMAVLNNLIALVKHKKKLGPILNIFSLYFFKFN